MENGLGARLLLVQLLVTVSIVVFLFFFPFLEGWLL